MENLIKKTIDRLIAMKKETQTLDDNVFNFSYGITCGFIAAYTQVIIDSGCDIDFIIKEGKTIAIKVNDITYTI